MGRPFRTAARPDDCAGGRGVGSPGRPCRRLLVGHTQVSVEMAIRRSKAFGSTPAVHIGIQMTYDASRVRGRADEIAVERLVVA